MTKMMEMSDEAYRAIVEHSAELRKENGTPISMKAALDDLLKVNKK